MEQDRIPRMRTAAKIVTELKALDPATQVTEHYIRSLAKDGTLPVVWAGRKALINLDDVLDILRSGTPKSIKEENTSTGNIRRINP